MKRTAIFLSLVLTAFTLSAAAAPAPTADGSGYGYKGSESTTGTAGIKALIVLVVLGAGAIYAAQWLKKNNFSIPGAAQGTAAGSVTEKKISVDKKIVKYENEGVEYILGVTKDNIILIDKIVRKPGKAKK